MRAGRKRSWTGTQAAAAWAIKGQDLGAERACAASGAAACGLALGRSRAALTGPPECPPRPATSAGGAGWRPWGLRGHSGCSAAVTPCAPTRCAKARCLCADRLGCDAGERMQPHMQQAQPETDLRGEWRLAALTAQPSAPAGSVQQRPRGYLLEHDDTWGCTLQVCMLQGPGGGAQSVRCSAPSATS